jgi:lysophospholipase L1-like esterase
MAVLAVLIVAGPSAAAEEKFLLRDGQRVVFLGDSNTFAGHFIAYLDAYLVTRFPGQKFELLNLGLPSETVSGLSEPDHPYPRPDVHDRLDRVLAKTKPDVVVACYGMNDGIYYPFSEERFKKYQEGMRRLVERCEKAGAKVVLMTPPPFDGQPVKAKLLPATADKFSWLRPFEDYDAVLGRYAEWLLTWREKGYVVVDLHAALDRSLKDRRADEPKYSFSGDGIHPNATGHWLIAQAVLGAWHAPAEADAVEIDAKAATVKRGKVSDLTVKDDVIRFSWQAKLPLPFDPNWEPKLAEREKIAERLSRYRLTVTGAAASGRCELYEGDRMLGRFTPQQLAEGVDLLAVKELSPNRRAAELGKLVAERQKLLGLAWLSDVGHKRPDTPKGLPLDEAKGKAADLEKKIRGLAEPTKLVLRLEPASP